MTSYIMYGLCIIVFLIAFIKDKDKTKKALKSSFKSFENIMPQFLSIVIIISLILSIVNPSTISNLIGPDSGILGTTISAIIGSVTMMPTFVAFSTGDSLLKGGAGYAQVAAMISTLTMVGVLTFALEAEYIGKKAAFFRNLIAFLFAFIVAFFVGGAF
ncbi:permease [Clostridium sp. CCUG 7971]|uniref:permease n=1 Tax=Clostridium sp. CCUG 7971 TaxID=2811414 RepID=UPI001ABB2681|nr:permease [Clostridium sp. CCUG 7971]MBO3443683.1 permease [Clostridium sp. CCUG 7971]